MSSKVEVVTQVLDGFLASASESEVLMLDQWYQSRLHPDVDDVDLAFIRRLLLAFQTQKRLD